MAAADTDKIIWDDERREEHCVLGLTGRRAFWVKQKLAETTDLLFNMWQ